MSRIADIAIAAHRFFNDPYKECVCTTLEDDIWCKYCTNSFLALKNITTGLTTQNLSDLGVQ